MLSSKLPNTGTSIFSVMSALAREHGAINLSQGFPNFDPPEGLQALVGHYIAHGNNQYAPMPGVPALRQAIAHKHTAATGRAIDPDTQITVTAGATQAIFTAILALVRPGDEVILFEPAYDSYRPAVELCGGTVVALPLRAPDFKVDWVSFAAHVGPRTRLVIVNSPHNPTGTVWQHADWLALSDAIAEHDVFVLSDEVYELLVYDGQPYASLLDYPQLLERGMATFSFGKTFHATGWKLGYCIGGTEWMHEFRKIHQFNVFAVNTPMQCALADYLHDPAHYQGLAPFYQTKRDLFAGAMADTALRALPCAGTYFQLYDYSAVSDLPDVDFATWLTTQVGVACIPVSAFRSGATEERLIRLCFAKTDDVLLSAAERLKAYWS